MIGGVGREARREWSSMPLPPGEGGRHVGVEGDQGDVVGPVVADRDQTWPMSGLAALTSASMLAGDMFLPAALMISSFLRSTIFR